MESVIAFFLLFLTIGALGLCYKNRHIIARWLNDTSLTVTDTKRKKYLRREIEDAEEELEEIEDRESKKKAETAE